MLLGGPESPVCFEVAPECHTSSQRRPENKGQKKDHDDAISDLHLLVGFASWDHMQSSHSASSGLASAFMCFEAHDIKEGLAKLTGLAMLTNLSRTRFVVLAKSLASDRASSRYVHRPPLLPALVSLEQGS